ncbi:MAG: phage late control D family protein [Planctomycetota bacterium]
MANDPQVPDFKVELNGSPLANDLLQQLLSIEVQQSARLIDMAILRFSNPHGLVADAAVFAPGKAVKVQAGYVGAVEPVFDGEVVSLEPEFPISGNPTVVVRAYDKLHRFRRGSFQRTFLSQKVSDVVKSLASEEGLSPEVDDTGDKHDWLLQNNVSNVDYIHELGRAHGYEVRVVDGTKLQFKKPSSSAGKELTVTWGEDLKSFYVKSSVTNVQTDVVVRCWNMKDKKAIIEKNEALKAKLGAKEIATDAAKKAFGEGKLQVSIRMASTPAEAKAMASAIFNERALDAVQGRGTCLGNTKLKPGQVIELVGMGKMWSGQYYVTAATHILHPSAGYTTEFRVARTGTGYDAPNTPVDPTPPAAETGETQESDSMSVRVKR